MSRYPKEESDHCSSLAIDWVRAGGIGLLEPPTLLFSRLIVSDSLQPPWTAARQASLSLIISQSLPKFMSIASVMPSSHLILWCPLLLLPSVFPFYLQFSSITWSCLTLCDLMDCSTPGFPVHHQLVEITETHVHWFGDAIHHLILLHPPVPFSSCIQSSPASGSFQMSRFFTSGGRSIRVSTSASVLPMNIQDWFPLGWTGWISLPSKGLSRVFTNTTVQKHQFFSAQLSI